MPKLPSMESQLRSVRRELARTQRELSAARQERFRLDARATHAEQDAAEWRKRFDQLLARDQTNVGCKNFSPKHGGLWCGNCGYHRDMHQ
jgi:chromosome segregation ATPase